MTREIFAALVASTVLALAAADTKHCYWPDGSLTDSGTQPCNTTAEVSACCDPRDACTTSGFCLGASGWIYRSACTDQTWTSSDCPSECHIDPILKSLYSSYTPIYACVAGLYPNQFCCGSYATNNSNCCGSNFTLGNTGLAFKAGTDAAEAQLSSLSSALAAATASSSIITVTTTATATATPSSSSSSSSSTLGTAIGAGVGVPLGVLALGLISFLVWRERRRYLALKQGNSEGWTQPNTMGPGYGHSSSGWGGSTAPISPYSPSQPPVGSPYTGSMPLPQGEQQSWKPTPPVPVAEVQGHAMHELKG